MMKVCFIYIATTIPVAIGIAIASHPGFAENSIDPGRTVLEMLLRYDGGHYRWIAERGYWYDPQRASVVAFFPAFPLLGSLLARTGIPAGIALPLVANLAFLATLIVFTAYLRNMSLPTITTLFLFGLWPVGFCFRMAYSESLFLLTTALMMLGWSRRWPLWVMVLIAGASTAIRPVGVAVAATVLISLLMDSTRGSLRRRISTCFIAAPAACWGLIAYMIYLWVAFHDPIAFVQAQGQWRAYTPEHTGPFHKGLRLLIGEPIWGSYLPGSKRHWMLVGGGHPNPLHGTAFWNSILFILAGVAVAFGWRKRWLSREESLLGFFLLLIPYLGRADEQSMISHARFAAVVLPAFVVMGRWLGMLAIAARCVLLILLATFLTLWTALFAAGWPLL